MFYQIDHIYELKTNIYNFMKTRINSCIISDHNAVKLKIDSNKFLINIEAHEYKTTHY